MSSFLASIASTSTSAHSSDAPKKTGPTSRHKLPSEAAAILKDFYNNVSRKPDSLQRRELLAKIVTIRDAEWYTLQHVTNWFNLKRGTDKEKEAAKLSTDSILWPSLSPRKLAKLKTLLSETPHPTPVHLEVWSRTLQAEPDHVDNWVKLNPPHTSTHTNRTEHDHERYTLPTPEGTASPEPQGLKIAPTPPMSPLVSSSSMFTQVFDNLGPPAHIGPTPGGTWQLGRPQTAFAAVQPVATIMTSMPMTPTSPVAPPPSSLSRAELKTKAASAGVSLRYSSPTVPIDHLKESIHRKKLKIDVPSASSSRAKPAPSPSPSLPRPATPKVPSAVQLRDRQVGPTRKLTTPIPRPAMLKADSSSSLRKSIETKPRDSSSASASVSAAAAPSSRAKNAPSGSQPPTGSVSLQALSTIKQLVREKLAAAKTDPPPPPPKSLAELAQRLEPAFQLSQALQRGEFAAIGLVPAKRHRREDVDDGVEDMDLSAD